MHFDEHGTVNMGRYQNSVTLECVRLSLCSSVCSKWDDIKILGCPMLVRMRVAAGAEDESTDGAA